MDDQQLDGMLEAGKEKNKNCENHSNHNTQPECITEMGDIPDPLSAKVPCSNGIGHGGRDESLTDLTITSENALLLPDHVTKICHKIEKGKIFDESPSSPNGATLTDTMSNGSLPICTPPTPSTGQRPSEPKHVCIRPGQPHKKHLTSTSKSQQSLKSNATQIQEVAGDDCCVRCVLSCLFCELLSLCSAVAECLACGGDCEALCCCGEACGGDVCCCCEEDPCSALLDCAILEDCCQSGDCLEICLECCSICFPA